MNIVKKYFSIFIIYNLFKVFIINNYENKYWLLSHEWLKIGFLILSFNITPFQ